MATTRQLIAKALKAEDQEFRHAYAESFLNSRIALQIRGNRKARNWTQKRLAQEAGMHQSQIPPLESIDNDAWKISTLLKIAAALDLVLIVKFESFGNALNDFSSSSAEDLIRPSFDDDPAFSSSQGLARKIPSAPATAAKPAGRFRIERSAFSREIAIPVKVEMMPHG